jgi:hypothetical protein
VERHSSESKWPNITTFLTSTWKDFLPTLHLGIKKKRTTITREKPPGKSKSRRSRLKELKHLKRELDLDKKQARSSLMKRKMTRRKLLQKKMEKKSQLRKTVLGLMKKTDQKLLKSQSLSLLMATLMKILLLLTLKKKSKVS